MGGQEVLPSYTAGTSPHRPSFTAVTDYCDKPPALDKSNCFPLAFPAGGSELGRCRTCPVQNAPIVKLKDKHACNRIEFAVAYRVDTTTGCGACPAGSVPWKITSYTSSTPMACLG